MITHYKVGGYSILPNNPNTWIPYSSTITKTIYDPCPYGYRVPINESWTGWATDASKAWTRYAITGGLSWPADNGGWWPPTGYRDGSSAILYEIGHAGWYWSSSRFSNAYQAYSLGFTYGGSAYLSNISVRSHGFPVRCIEEKKINKVSFEIMSLRA